MGLVLGVSAYFHDSAAALTRDGHVIGAAQEERFSRKKHDAGFPIHAIRSVLSDAGAVLGDLDAVVFYDKPFLKFERLIETYLAFAPRGLGQFAKSVPVWLKDKLFLKGELFSQLKAIDSSLDAWDRLMFSEHHLSHAASAFYPSPFEEAVVLTLDGVGEWATASVGLGHGTDLRLDREITFPHSIGLLYSAFTYHLGFRVNSGEYKVMGLAPYGEPRFAGLIKEHLIDIAEDGSFWLDQRYFEYAHGLRMTNRNFAKLFGIAPRKPDGEPLTQTHMDLAASVQKVTEEVVVKLATSAAATYGVRNLCLAGGVALNCVANGLLLRERIFDNVWVQPASGDAGGALGAALAYEHLHLGKPRHSGGSDGMSGAYLGPSYEQQDIESALLACGAMFETLGTSDMLDVTAKALADGKAVGWHQGRAEFGPRALGNRSILADPRSPTMQSTLNYKVKFREGFRPFAPAVRREDLEHWFDLGVDSPYMLFTAQVAEAHARPIGPLAQGFERLKVPTSDIPAVTHVDGSARIQTVHAETNPLFHDLLGRFGALTGVPVLVNTSFNVRGEPIVNTPQEAFYCFMATDLDLLVVGRSVLVKERQDKSIQLPARHIEAD